MAERVATGRRASTRQLAARAVLHTVRAEARLLLAEHRDLLRDYHDARWRACGAADEEARLLLLAAETAMDQHHEVTRTLLLRITAAAGALGDEAERLAPAVRRAVDGFSRRRLGSDDAMGAAWARIAASRAFLERAGR